LLARNLHACRTGKVKPIGPFAISHAFTFIVVARPAGVIDTIQGEPEASATGISVLPVAEPSGSAGTSA
jgi:hypothetical protein